jgi:hypothetical protein
VPAAPAGLPEPRPAETKAPAPAVTGKWDMSLYGFVELDSMWDSNIVGAQYYLPPSAKLWLAGTYSHLSSDHRVQLSAWLIF